VVPRDKSPFSSEARRLGVSRLDSFSRSSAETRTASPHRASASTLLRRPAVSGPCGADACDQARSAFASSSTWRRQSYPPSTITLPSSGRWHDLRADGLRHRETYRRFRCLLGMLRPRADWRGSRSDRETILRGASGTHDDRKQRQLPASGERTTPCTSHLVTAGFGKRQSTTEHNGKLA
jgi:hypothetical protein